MGNPPKFRSLSRVEQHLAACIRVRREVCGLSASDLDRAANLKPGSVSRLERNKKRLKPDALIALSRALKLDIDSFFEDIPLCGRFDELPPENGISTSDIESLVNAFHAIDNPEARRGFASLLRSIATNPLYNTSVSKNDGVIMESKRSAS